jgi:dienelactone hydrolase
MKSNLFICSILVLTLTACGGSQQTEQQEVSRDESEMAADTGVQGMEVKYATDSVTMNGYIAMKDDGTKKPGILVVHEWWGHNEHARTKARKLAEMGYVALAVDMYGSGKQANHPSSAQKFSGMVMSNIDVAKARFMQAMETLKQNPNVDPDKIGAIGFCFGGSVVLTMANLGVDLDAVVAFHAGLGLPAMPGTGEPVKAQKVMVLNGGADPFVTAGQVSALDSAMQRAEVNYEYIAYKGVKHAYTNPGADSLGQKFELPLAYDKEADEKSWNQMSQMFREVFGS